jgi:hypothetical protein
MLEYRVDSRSGQDAATTAILLLKVYKEFTCTAFSHWAASSTPSLASFFKGKNVRQALLDILAATLEVCAMPYMPPALSVRIGVRV